MVENAVKLLTAFAALLGAVAWPILIGFLVFFFRKEIRAAATRLPIFLDRVQKMKIAGIEAELEKLATEPQEKNPEGSVTSQQIRIAARIQADAADVGADALAHEMDKLCIEYDTIRLTMPSGRDKTDAMTKVMVRMRSLGPAVAEKIEIYMGSGSPGSRLAAVAIMQMAPQKADITWLLERFSCEQPFIFYHAALALSNAANSRSGAERQAIREAAKKAYDVVFSFPGKPDEGTLHVLKPLAGVA